MADLTKNVNVVITGEDSKFRAAAKSSEKATSDLEKKASGDLKKIASNFAGMFSDKGKDSGIAKFTGEVTSGTSALSSFAGPAAIATGAIVGIGSAAVGAGVALFNMAKEASDYGSELADAQAKTGLTAESLSALRYQANLSGSDFGAVSGAIGKFSKLVGEAAKGSDEAKGKLKALGIDPQEAVKDLDGALGKAFKTINDAKPGVEQMTAATDAFGKSGADLVPTITGMNGDFAALKKRATELGIVLSEEDVKAADDFGDTLDTLSMQAKATSAKFALQFAPVITEAMNGISKSLAQNQDKWREWGKTIGDTMRGIREFSKSEAGATTRYWLEAYLKLQFYAPLWIAEKFRQSGAEAKQAEYNNLLANSENAMPGVADPTDKTLAAPSVKTLDTGAADNEDYLSRAAQIAKDSKSKNKKDKEVSLSFDDLLKAMRVGTAKQESSGNQFAKNARTGASGTFQVMPENIPKWTRKTFGVSMSVEQFKANAQAQVAVFNKYMGDYLKKGLAQAGGNWQEGVRRAAAAWYGGEDDMGNFDANFGGKGKEPTFRQYTSSVLRRTKSALGKNAGYELPVLNGVAEIGEGAKALADYEKQVKMLAASTESARVEFEILAGTYDDLKPKEKEQLLAYVQTKEAFDRQAKASEEYYGQLDKLGSKYDDVTGVQKTATEELEAYLKTAKEAGVVIGLYTEQTARYKAAVIDAATAKEKLTEAEKEYQATVSKTTEEAAGYQLTDPGTPEGAFKKPNSIEHKKLSAYDLGKYSGEDFKTGGVLDQETVDTQVSMFGTLKDAGMDAFQAISGEIGNAAANWIAFGDASGQSMREMTANVLASVSAQALGMGLLELGIGIAALTPWGAAVYGPAPIHFKSAAVLLGIGAGFGIGARAVGSGSGGSKDKSSGGSSDKSPSDYLKENSSDDRRMDFLRQSQNDQSRKDVEYRREIGMLTDAVNNFNQKVETASSSDVFIRGANANRGIFADRTTSELSKNSTTATKFGRVLGMK